MAEQEREITVRGEEEIEQIVEIPEQVVEIEVPEGVDLTDEEAARLATRFSSPVVERVSGARVTPSGRAAAQAAARIRIRIRIVRV